LAKQITVTFAGDTSNLDKAFARVEKTSSGVQKAFKTVAATAAFGVVTDQIGDVIGAASNLNETMNKASEVFGSSATAMTSWAQNAATSMGLSQQQALEAASSFGNMFSQLGIGSGQAAQMSQRIVQLAADFASFHNADITEVLQAQQAAFRGEYDSLQRFLPTISAAAIQQEAMVETGKKSKDSLTDQEKALAANTLMFKGAGAAIGDFARTSDGAANQSRTLSAEFKDAQAAIGQGLLPVFTDVVGYLVNDVIPAFRQLTNTASEPPDVSGFTGFVNAFKDEVRDLIGWVATIPAPVMKLFGLFSGSFKDAANQVDHFAEQMHRSSTEAYMGAHANDAHNAALKVSKDILKQATEATDKKTGASKKSADQLKDEAKAEKALGDARIGVRQADLALEEATHNLATAQKEYDDFLRTGGIDAEKVKDAQQDLLNVQKDLDKATRDVADAQEKVNEALKPATQQEQAKAGRDVAAAQDTLTSSQLDLKDAQDEYYRVFHDSLSTDEEKTRAYLRVNEASRGVADAQDRLTEAMKAQTTTSLQGTTASQTYKDAVTVLQEKQQALKDVEDKRKISQDALNTAQALGKNYTDELWKVTDNLKNAQLDLDAKTWGAKKAHDELKKSVDDTKTSVRDAWANVNGYSDALNHVPKTVKTTMTYEEIYAVPAGTAQTDAQAYAKYLQEMTKSHPNMDPMPFDMWVKSAYNPNRHRARGGPVTAGMAYMVGEAGPELFVPGRSGTIVPNGGVGGLTVNVNAGWVADKVSLVREIVAQINADALRGGTRVLT